MFEQETVQAKAQKQMETPTVVEETKYPEQTTVITEQESINTEKYDNAKETEIVTTLITEQDEILTSPVMTSPQETETKMQTNTKYQPEQESTSSACITQIMVSKPNSTSLFLFNSADKTISELDIQELIPTEIFLPNHAFINIVPHIYISGGINETDSLSSDSFYRITKPNVNDFSFNNETLSSLNIPRSYHTMIYFKEKNTIFAISGSHNHTCEKYSFEQEFWSIIPELHYSREHATTLIHNSSLYVFFGYDRENNQFCTTIERLDISDGNYLEKEWEVIQPSMSQELTERMNMSYIVKKDSVLLLGGVNNVNKCVNNIVEYKFENNSGNIVQDMNLLEECAFIQGEFVKEESEKENKKSYNFTMEFQIIEHYIEGENEVFNTLK
jgi:hypothetical protein